MCTVWRFPSKLPKFDEGPSGGGSRRILGVFEGNLHTGRTFGQVGAGLWLFWAKSVPRMEVGGGWGHFWSGVYLAWSAQFGGQNDRLKSAILAKMIHYASRFWAVLAIFGQFGHFGQNGPKLAILAKIGHYASRFWGLNLANLAPVGTRG